MLESAVGGEVIGGHCIEASGPELGGGVGGDGETGGKGDGVDGMTVDEPDEFAAAEGTRAEGLPIGEQF